MRRFLLALALVALSGGTALATETVEVEAPEGEYLVLDGRRYRGPFLITAEDGLLVVETITLDQYLEGIREVPFSWGEEALKAQAVAARTYLASNLGSGAYDICATAACQVYAGVETVLGPDGERWQAAVAETGGQILVHEGEPIRAYYSSTTGGRTRNIEDIWPGADPAPYLVGVPSPGEESPFVEWSWELPEYLMARLLREAGLIEGRLLSVTTRTTADGEGPWTVRIVSSRSTVDMDTWTLRGELNAAARIMPDHLPAPRPDGRRYPTTVLSPEYVIRREVRITRAGGEPLPVTHYVVEGGGWGHLIGLSQYGAQAMAERGAGYEEILGYYYGGLRPVDGSGILPSTVRVAIVIGASSLRIGGTGPITVEADGEPVSGEPFGIWRLRAGTDGLVVIAPGRSRPSPGEPFFPE